MNQSSNYQNNLGMMLNGQMAPPSAGNFNLDFMGYQNNSPSSAMGIGNFDFNDYAQPAGAVSQTGNQGGGVFGGMFGQDGWGNMALSGLQTGFGIYGGLKQLGMAKDQLDFQKKAFNKNYEAQKQRTNTQLRDRQAQRYRQRPDVYQSVDEYMNKNGVK